VLPEAKKGSLLWRVGGVLKTMRPHQWLKNAFVLAPVFFAKDIFNPDLLLHAIAAFSAFCLLAGAVYTLNDLEDLESDQAHPVKRFRPIPSGRVPVGLAKMVGAGLIVVSLGGGLLISPAFSAVALGYLLNNVAYSFKPLKLKNIAYVDVMSISAGFVLRVLAGGLATGIKVSGYLFACTALLSLFLGFGKRRHEFAQSHKKKREALDAYSERGLDIALGLTALATVGTYLAYTLDPQTRQFFQSNWLWVSTAFTVLGMGRFLQLITGSSKAESPTQEMLRDVPFIVNLIAWVLFVLVTVYKLRFEGQP
jgi:4-hydroxybenzoate polyprenyltransferase